MQIVTEHVVEKKTRNILLLQSLFTLTLGLSVMAISSGENRWVTCGATLTGTSAIRFYGAHRVRNDVLRETSAGDSAAVSSLFGSKAAERS